MTIDFSIVMVILNFILLMLILNKLLYKPLKNYLQDRQKQILTDMQEAKVSIDKANELAKQREEELKAAMEEARKLNLSIKLEAEKQAVEIINKAKQQEKDIIKQTDIRIEQEMKLALKNIEGQISELVCDLSAQFISSKIDKETDKKYIEQLIAERSKA